MSQNVLDTSYHTEDDKLIIRRSQDVQRILDFNKERNIDGHNRKSDMRLAGSIPFVVAEMWAKRVWRKNRIARVLAYVKKKLLSR